MTREQGSTPEDVGRYYDRWTERYLASFGDSIQAHRPAREADLHGYLMRRMGVRDGWRLLDAGCGVCGPSRYLARHADVRIDAVTVSAVQARIARQRIADEALSQRIRVTLGDFHQLASIVARESIDLVFFLESLSHSADPERALASAYEVLRPGGFVYIKDFFIRVCASDDEQQRVLKVISNVNRLFAVKTAWVEQITASLRAVGFLPVWIEAPRFDVDNSSWQDFESTHELDLFDGERSFDWSQWWEIKYQKP